MSKELLYDRVNDRQLAKYTCDSCGSEIGVEPYYDEIIGQKYAGPNDGIGGKREHECINCRRHREAQYDNFVTRHRS